jgi:hypothetical protein
VKLTRNRSGLIAEKLVRADGGLNGLLIGSLVVSRSRNTVTITRAWLLSRLVSGIRDPKE